MMKDNIVLVVGECGAGKSHICNLLPKDETRKLSNINILRAQAFIDKYKGQGVTNIILINSLYNDRRNASKIALMFAKNFEHVYVQCYPRDVEVMVRLLTKEEPLRERGREDIFY